MDASHCGSRHPFLSSLTNAGVLLYCAGADGKPLTPQNELAKAKRRREESMLERPRILTAAAGPVPGKATPAANPIPVLQPRAAPT